MIGLLVFVFDLFAICELHTECVQSFIFAFLILFKCMSPLLLFQLILSFNFLKCGVTGTNGRSNKTWKNEKVVFCQLRFWPRTPYPTSTLVPRQQVLASWCVVAFHDFGSIRGICPSRIKCQFQHDTKFYSAFLIPPKWKLRHCESEMPFPGTKANFQ